jgi:hypothetical protein
MEPTYAVTGQTIRQRWSTDERGNRGEYRFFVRPGAMVHLTDGTAYSRTGRNLRALCGVSVRPDRFELPTNYRVCPTCEAAR